MDWYRAVRNGGLVVLLGAAACGRTWDPLGYEAYGEGGAEGVNLDCEQAEEVELSVIWVANSTEGTVSKINTRTGIEVARYRTGAGPDDQPSRTSVSLHGDAVVANRGPRTGGDGGITVIAGSYDRCADTDGDGEIRSSQGPEDVLPWGQDECVLWHAELPSRRYSRGPRPVGWDARVGGATVWIGWQSEIATQDHPGDGAFIQFDGASGEELDRVNSFGAGFPYGGAMGGRGSFWSLGKGHGPVIRIDGATHKVRAYDFDVPEGTREFAYGMALDRHGRPWVTTGGTLAGLNVDTGRWTYVEFGSSNVSAYGVAVDAKDRAWVADARPGCGLAIVDTATAEIIDPLVGYEGCVKPVGVSIDGDGYVWSVDRSANGKAVKIDPDTLEVVLRVEGLVGPYTYSDMTGHALAMVTAEACD